MTDMYAIRPSYSPEPVSMYLFTSDEEALDHGIYVAAHDLLNGYCSPTAEVWKVTGTGLTLVGRAKAANAAASWPWAHPAVEDKLAEELAFHQNAAAESGADVEAQDWSEFISDFAA